MITQVKGQAHFWKIRRLYYDIEERDLQVELYGYKKANDAPNQAVHRLKFTLSGNDFPDVNQRNLIAAIENILRTKLNDRKV